MKVDSMNLTGVFAVFINHHQILFKNLLTVKAGHLILQINVVQYFR